MVEDRRLGRPDGINQPAPGGSEFSYWFTRKTVERMQSAGFNRVLLRADSVNDSNQIADRRKKAPVVGYQPSTPFEEELFNEPSRPGEAVFKTLAIDPATTSLSIAEMKEYIDAVNASGRLPPRVIAALPSPAEVAQLAQRVARRQEKDDKPPYAWAYTLTNAVDDDGNHIFVGNERKGKGMTMVHRDETSLANAREVYPLVEYGISMVYRSEALQDRDIAEREAPLLRLKKTPEMSMISYRFGVMVQSALDGDLPISGVDVAHMEPASDARLRPQETGKALAELNITLRKTVHAGEHSVSARTPKEYTILPPLTNVESTDYDTRDNVIRDPAYFVLGYIDHWYSALDQCGLPLPPRDEIQELLAESTQGEEFNAANPNNGTERTELAEHARRTALNIAQAAHAYRDRFDFQEPLQPCMRSLYNHLIASDADPAGLEKLLYVIHNNGIHIVHRDNGEEGRQIERIEVALSPSPEDRRELPINGNGNGSSSHL